MNIRHTQAGKGRTGFLIACLLLHLNLEDTSHGAILFFSNQRTSDGKALNQQSQIRYVGYWDQVHRTRKDRLKRMGIGTARHQRGLLSLELCLPPPKMLHLTKLTFTCLLPIKEKNKGSPGNPEKDSRYGKVDFLVHHNGDLVMSARAHTHTHTHRHTHTHTQKLRTFVRF